MISKTALDHYLNRSVRDHRALKKLSEQEIDRRLGKLDPQPRFHTKPRLHQKVAFLLGVQYPKFCLFLDMGCVDADTEFLSPSGWIKISEYAGSKVAEYDPHTQTARFVQPSRYIVKRCTEMLHYKTTRGLDQMYSLDHRMLVVGNDIRRGSKAAHAWKKKLIYPHPKRSGKWFIETTPTLLEQHYNQKLYKFFCETTFFLNDVDVMPLTDEQIRVQVAFQADGSLEYLVKSIKGVVHVKKERKKIRMRRLLRDAKTSYTECKQSNGYSSFRFTPPLPQKNYWGTWWKASVNQRKVICDEVGHWDGAFKKRNAISFSSMRKSDADFIQYCFASTGRRASLLITYAHGKPDPCYKVHAIGTGRTTNLAQYSNKPIRVEPRNRKMYCFAVPSSFLVFRRNGCIFVSGNTGKTWVALNLIRYWRSIGKARRPLVLVPNVHNIYNWLKQRDDHTPKLRMAGLFGSSRDRWEMIGEEQDDCYVLNYAGLVALATRRGKNSKGKAVMVIDQDRLKHLIGFFDMLVLDESTSCKNWQSLTYKICSEIAKACPIRYALTGTPLGRDPHDLWAQFHVIDNGETLGRTLGIFRAAFFSSKVNYWGGYEHTFKPSTKPDLIRLMGDRSISYRAEDCIDLPQVNRIVREFVMLGGAQTYYGKVVDGIKTIGKNMTLLENAFMQLREIASGFLIYKDEGKRVELGFKDNPKIEILLELIESMGPNAKMVVFHEFIYSGKLIIKALNMAKIGCADVWSGTKDPAGSIKKFVRDPKCRVLVGNNKSIALGLDELKVANYGVFYESPTSPIIRVQAERRLIRQGQKNHVFLFDIIARKSIEGKILAYLKEGRDLMRDLLSGKTQVEDYK